MHTTHTLAWIASLALLTAACGQSEPGSSVTPRAQGDFGSSSSDMGADLKERPPALDAHPRSCADETNPEGLGAPASDFERLDWRFEAQAGVISVEGEVISDLAVSSPPVIDRAFLLGTGGFLDDGCIVRHQGTSFRWEGVACQSISGTLFNVFVVEPDELEGLEGLYRGGATLRISGYPITRFLDFSPGGGYWSPGSRNDESGQLALWVTDICTL